MSIFNKPYRTNKEMRADAKNGKRKRNLKNREMVDTNAHQIFKAVLDAINGGVDKFTKKEMVELVSKVKKSQLEWVIWDRACTTAIRKIRSYLWSDDLAVTDKRMFHYVRPEERYYLINVDDAGRSNIVYEAYDRKMKGIQKKQRSLATSIYGQVLELDTQERKKLLKRLKDEGFWKNALASPRKKTGSPLPLTE